MPFCGKYDCENHGVYRLAGAGDYHIGLAHHRSGFDLAFFDFDHWSCAADAVL